MSIEYKEKRSKGFYDEFNRLEKLTEKNDVFFRLSKRIDFELFRPILESGLTKKDKGNGGAKPYDYVMMFKILIYQKYNNISDDKMEFMMLDCLSINRFLGLTFADKIPDAKTIWHFRELLTNSNLIVKLFGLFQQELNRCGLILNEGKIIDATIVETPIQRNSKEENREIKAGKIPEKWKENPHKLSQKDTDAKWVKKNNVSYYGYKNHIKIDTKSKIINSYTVSEASLHDSQPTEKLLAKKDRGQPMNADSAYTGEPIADLLKKKHIKGIINEKGYKGHPLTEEQKENNRIKSKTRARVEHIFGFIHNSMNRIYIRTIGIKRARSAIGLINLTYNLFRAVQLGYKC